MPDFRNFSESKISGSDIEQLPAEFEQAAAPVPRVTVTLDLDADLLAWLKAQPTEWQREINNTVRFFMETSTAKQWEFEPDPWEPGEMQTPPTP